MNLRRKHIFLIWLWFLTESFQSSLSDERKRFIFEMLFNLSEVLVKVRFKTIFSGWGGMAEISGKLSITIAFGKIGPRIDRLYLLFACGCLAWWDESWGHSRVLLFLERRDLLQWQLAFEDLAVRGRVDFEFVHPIHILMTSNRMFLHLPSTDRRLAFLNCFEQSIVLFLHLVMNLLSQRGHMNINLGSKSWILWNCLKFICSLFFIWSVMFEVIRFSFGDLKRRLDPAYLFAMIFKGFLLKVA